MTRDDVNRVVRDKRRKAGASGDFMPLQGTVDVAVESMEDGIDFGAPGAAGLGGKLRGIDMTIAIGVEFTEEGPRRTVGLFDVPFGR